MIEFRYIELRRSFIICCCGRIFRGKNIKMKSPNSSGQRANKPMMERKRRARINDYLNQLKDMVLQALKKENNTSSKFEKADILEMTVDYLKTLHRSQNAKYTETKAPHQIQTGSGHVKPEPVPEDQHLNRTSDINPSSPKDMHCDLLTSPRDQVPASLINNGVSSQSDKLHCLSVATSPHSSIANQCDNLSNCVRVQQSFQSNTSSNNQATSYRLVPSTTASGHVQLSAILVSTNKDVNQWEESTSPTQDICQVAQNCSHLRIPEQPHQLHQTYCASQIVSPSYVRLGTPLYSLNQSHNPNYILTLQVVNDSKVTMDKSKQTTENVWRPW